MWRAALTPQSLLTLDEAVEALPCAGPTAREWLLEHVMPAGEVAEVEVYCWGEVLAILHGYRPIESSPDGHEDVPVRDGCEDDLLTAQQLAEALLVPLSTVHRWTSEGRIPHYKLGHRTVRYRLSEVLESAVQTAAARKEAFDGRTQARKPMAHRLSLPRSRDAPAQEIPPHDWSRNNQEGGTSS